MTNFSWMIDGSIVALYLLLVMFLGVAVSKHMKNVDDFMVAGREVKLYMGIASLAAAEFGIISCMASGQLGYMYGFAGSIIGIIIAIAMFTIGKTGFVIHKLRSSNVKTVPEFFETKFGPHVRWASGVVIVLGGLLNMGVFLRTGGDFLVAVAGLNPDKLEITMTLLLMAVLVYVILGGMLSIIVTDLLQFTIMSSGIILVTIMVIYKIGWGTIIDTVQQNYGAGGFNPFVNKNLGWEYILYNLLAMFAIVITWMPMIARVLASKDAATGQKIYTHTSFFYVVRFLLPGIWGIAALAVLTPEQVGDSTILAMPKFLAVFLPVGVVGLLIASMLAADMSTQASYIIGWASVIYNDILSLFRKGTWSEKKQIFWNRSLVAIIGVFLLFYGLWYPLKGDLWTYMAVTGTIYSVSISTLLIAGCYWDKANNWGAFAAIATGAIIPISFLVLEQIPATAALAKEIGPYKSGLSSFVLTALSMVVFSKLKTVLKRV